MGCKPAEEELRSSFFLPFLPSFFPSFLLLSFHLIFLLAYLSPYLSIYSSFLLNCREKGSTNYSNKHVLLISVNSPKSRNQFLALLAIQNTKPLSHQQAME
jgi:hypothetical protein